MCHEQALLTTIFKLYQCMHYIVQQNSVSWSQGVAAKNFNAYKPHQIWNVLHHVSFVGQLPHVSTVQSRGEVQTKRISAPDTQTAKQRPKLHASNSLPQHKSWTARPSMDEPHTAAASAHHEVTHSNRPSICSMSAYRISKGAAEDLVL